MKLYSRLLRQIIIAIIFLTTFFLFGYGTKKITETPAACDDRIKNGQEEGVDCGLFACGNYCEPDLDPPQVISVQLIKVAKNDYDFVAEISNPHKNFGSSEIVYELTIYNASDKELLKREGTFYMLPGLNFYVILPALEILDDSFKPEFIIKSVRWQKLNSLEGMNFTVRNEKYTSYNGNESNFDAGVINESNFDFDRVDVSVVVRGQGGKIIAVNRTEISTFSARTERHFRVTWPFFVKGTIAEIEVKLATNLFENSNFIKNYGSETEKFQIY